LFDDDVSAHCSIPSRLLLDFNRQAGTCHLNRRSDKDHINLLPGNRHPRPNDCSLGGKKEICNFE
jgi:hypothetical protein